MYVLFSEFFWFGGRADHPPGDLKAANEERDPEVNAIVWVNPADEREEGWGGCVQKIEQLWIFPENLSRKKKKIFTAGIFALHIQHSQQTHNAKKRGVHCEWNELWSVEWPDPCLLPSPWEGNEG